MSDPNNFLSLENNLEIEATSSNKKFPCFNILKPDLKVKNYHFNLHFIVTLVIRGKITSKINF